MVNIMISLLGYDVSQFGTQASMNQMNMLSPSWRQKCSTDRRRTGAKRELTDDDAPKMETVKG